MLFISLHAQHPLGFIWVCYFKVLIVDHINRAN